MEQLFRKIALKITDGASLSGEKQEVAVYGFLALLQMAAILGVSSIFGLLFSVWAEVVLIFLGIGLLRRSTGGAHASTMLSCTVMSIAVILTLSLLCGYLFIKIDNYLVFITIQVALYAFCGTVIYKKAPLDTPNKPIKKPEKIKRLRAQSLFTALCFFVASGILYSLKFTNDKLISLSFALNMALLWQTFTLTNAGKWLIAFFDRLFIAKGKP